MFTQDKFGNSCSTSIRLPTFSLLTYIISQTCIPNLTLTFLTWFSLNWTKLKMRRCFLQRGSRNWRNVVRRIESSATSWVRESWGFFSLIQGENVTHYQLRPKSFEDMFHASLAVIGFNRHNSNAHKVTESTALKCTYTFLACTLAGFEPFFIYRRFPPFWYTTPCAILKVFLSKKFRILHTSHY
jgi:hypothetical protein